MSRNVELSHDPTTGARLLRQSIPERQQKACAWCRKPPRFWYWWQPAGQDEPPDQVRQFCAVKCFRAFEASDEHKQSKEERDRDRRYFQAIHEAGHYVAHVATLPDKARESVSVGDRSGGEPTTKVETALCTDSVVVLYAGGAAELAFGRAPDLVGDGADREEAHWTLELLDEVSQAKRLQQRARGIVQRHRGTVEALAGALLERGTLTAEEADAIVVPSRVWALEGTRGNG